MKIIRDDAGDRAAKHIKNLVNHDGVHDPGGFMHFLAKWADDLSAIGVVLAAAALVVAFVATGGTLGIALLVIGASLASAGAFAGHAYDMFALGGKLDC
ncbi:hypothetical protein ABZU86_10325 [Streptomyces sp. NPDC005271]|uniref:hypothetical protein n=1 Tax=unclassified Streptomyces TaxID=2593676 RepID=UPI0033A94A31